jgi:hypothetical protein
VDSRTEGKVLMVVSLWQFVMVKLTVSKTREQRNIGREVAVYLI